MLPIGQHIQITIPPEEETGLIVEKAPLLKVKVQEISPDIQVPFKIGSVVDIIRGKQIWLGGEVFIHLDHILLYK